MNADTLEAREQYRLDGAALLPAQLSQHNIAKVLDLLNELIRDLLSRTEGAENLPAKVEFGPNSIGLRFEGGVYFQYLSRDFEEVRAAVTEPSIARSVADVIESETIRFWYDELYVRWPQKTDNSTPWHHDIAALPFKGKKLPSVWFALGNISLGQSHFRTIEKSHTVDKQRYKPPTGREAKALLDGYTMLPDFDAGLAAGEHDARDWPLKLGRGVIFHPYCVHGTTANATPHPRVSLATRWIGDDAIWAPDDYSVAEPWAQPSASLAERLARFPDLLSGSKVKVPIE